MGNVSGYWKEGTTTTGDGGHIVVEPYIQRKCLKLHAFIAYHITITFATFPPDEGNKRP